MPTFGDGGKLRGALGEPRLLRFDPSALAGIAPGRVDPIDYIDGQPGLVVHLRPATVPRGAPLVISGWAIDPVTGDTPRAICILVDRSRSHLTEAGIERHDIAGSVAARTRRLGYSIVLPTSDLEASAHEARVFALSVDGLWYETDVAGFTIYSHVVPSTERQTNSARLHVETPVNATTSKDIQRGEPLPLNHVLLLHGWAMDPISLRGVAGIVVTDESGRTWTGAANLARPDVASMTPTKDHRLGYEVLVPAMVLGRGTHRLDITGVNHEGKRYANTSIVTVRVVGPHLEFPVAARASSIAPRFYAEFCVLSTVDGDQPGTPWRRFSGGRLEMRRSDTLRIRGWATAGADDPADDIFVELGPSNSVVPPARLNAQAGRSIPHDAHSSCSAVRDCWFTCDVTGFDLPLGSVDVSIAVVAPGRRAVSRALIATLRVEAD